MKPQFFPSAQPLEQATDIGFRFGSRGTHSSRTLMLVDLTSLMRVTTSAAGRLDYMAAITEGNCLGKSTASTKRQSAQRLSELYALDPSVVIFRVFRRLWDGDPASRPLLALLTALARDPLLMATAGSVISLPPDAEYQREPARQALLDAVGDRFNASILDKVLRNAASSWSQSGHLEGRTFKKRKKVTASAYAATFALYLAYQVGFRGQDIFSSGWFAVLDCSPARAEDLAMDAKRIGLIDMRTSSNVVDLRLDRLDPLARRA